MPSPLLVVTDRGSGDDGAALLDRLDVVLAAGARWVWFRERDMAAGPRAALAREVAGRVRAWGGVLTIGGDADLAAALGAQGVHLPGDATPADIARARRLLPHGLLGISAHTVRDIATAARHAVDYATLSPIFATASKPGYGPALGPEALREAAVHGLPVLALGGIAPTDVRTCRAAGAAGIAVMGGLMRSPDPGVTVRAYLTGLTVET